MPILEPRKQINIPPPIKLPVKFNCYKIIPIGRLFLCKYYQKHLLFSIVVIEYCSVQCRPSYYLAFFFFIHLELEAKLENSNDERKLLLER